MRSDIAVFGAAATAAIMVGVLIGSGASGVAVIFFALLGLGLMASIGRAMRIPVDAAWLPKWVILGFLAKLAGTFARYYMVTTFYGVGDSYRYYSVGTALAKQWRSGHVPHLTGSGSLGTQVVESVTGALFALITPDMLGGFVLFAILAYLGQLLLYAAFRRHAQRRQLKIYAILILLLPSYAFWPSSIGKDALVLLGLGACAYLVARSLEAFEVRWLLGLAIALGAVGLVRIHIAALVVGAFILAALLAKAQVRDVGAPMRRLVVLGAGVAAALVVIAVFPDVFGVDLRSGQDVDGFTADVVRRTSSGTAVEGGPVTSPADVPAALAHVLFRPFIFEASEIQHYFAALETAFLAGLFLWKLRSILRNLRRWRSNPYLVFSTFYTIGFAIAFSVVRNLGIIARQRGQVLAFFLCFVVALGWRDSSDDADVETPMDEIRHPETPSYPRAPLPAQRSSP